MSLKKIIALFVLGFVISTVTAQDVSVQNLRVEGQKAFKAKKYDLALSKFEEAIAASVKEGEKDMKSVYFGGMAAYKGQKYDKAIGFFSALESDASKKCKALDYLANIYKKQEKDDKHIEYLKKGITECAAKKGKFEKKLAKAYLIAGSAKYNAGAKIQASVASLQTTDPKYTAAMEKANKEFKASLVDLEAAYAIPGKKKKALLKMLSTVYTNLEMKAKATQMDKELAALGK